MNYATQLLGENLLTKRGYMRTSDVLMGKRFIMLFISASWCSACNANTPVVNNFNNILLQNNLSNYLDI